MANPNSVTWAFLDAPFTGTASPPVTSLGTVVTSYEPGDRWHLAMLLENTTQWVGLINIDAISAGMGPIDQYAPVSGATISAYVPWGGGGGVAGGSFFSVGGTRSWLLWSGIVGAEGTLSISLRAVTSNPGTESNWNLTPSTTSAATYAEISDVIASDPIRIQVT